MIDTKFVGDFLLAILGVSFSLVSIIVSTYRFLKNH